MLLKYLLMFFIMLINIVVLGKNLASMSGTAYAFELLAAFVFVLGALFAVKLFKKRVNYVYRLLALYFPLAILNFLYIYLSRGGIVIFSFVTLINLVGFLVAIFNIETKEEIYARKIKKTYQTIARELEPVTVGKPEVIVERIEPPKPPKTVVKKKARRKKFVASKTGTLYHTKKCPAAKFISSKNKVLLRTSADAKKKGYKKHNCVK